MDVVDEVAKQIGAINTIVRLKDGRLKGYNTDWMAAIGAVERQLISMRKGYKKRSEQVRFREEPLDERPLEGKHVVVLGAGGAARGMVFGAVERGAAQLTVVNRTLERAEKLIAEMSGSTKSCVCRAITPDVFAKGELTDVDVIMNSTSVGMHPHEDVSPVNEVSTAPELAVSPKSLLHSSRASNPHKYRLLFSSHALFHPLPPQSLLRKGQVVFDAVYTPRRTKLLMDAEAKGCEIVDGVEMFVGQALKQYELWTGTEPPRDVMEAAILKKLGIH